MKFANNKIKTDLFVDLIMQNAHDGLDTKIILKNHTIVLSHEGIIIKQWSGVNRGDVLEIQKDGRIFTLILIQEIIGAVTIM